MQKFIEKKYKIIVGVILGFIFIVSILNAKNDSAIFDEIAHIPAGYSYLKMHDIRLNPEHPPLLKDLSALPLTLLSLNFDTTLDFWTKDNADASQWNAGRYFLYGAGNNPDQIIFWSRVPFILLSLIFGWFIFFWTRKLAGISAGLFALTLYAFDPNILGHNHFVTTDLGIAIFITLAFYYYFTFLKDPTWKNILWAGLFLGLVQLTKFSSILIFPILVLATIIYPLVRVNHKKIDSNLVFKIKSLAKYFGRAIAVFIISLVVVWIGYFLNTYEMPKEKLPEIMSYYLKPTDPRPITIYTREVITAINNIPGLEPLADYIFGVARVVQRVGGGNTTYFMGQVSSQSAPAYFPVVFLAKEPIPILLFMLFALSLAFLKIVRTFSCSFDNFFAKNVHTISHYLRVNILEFSLFLFVIFYSLTSIFGNLNIGLRHLFPILPIIYILTAKNIFEFLEKKDISHHGKKSYLLITKQMERSPERKFCSAVVVVLIAYLIIKTIVVYPSYTSYFNESVGGSKNGYNYVADSNADWGQDLKRLKIFLNEHPEISNIRLDYFGGGNAQYYLGDKYIQWWSSKRPLEAGWYAISATLLQGSIYDKSIPNAESYRWLKNKKPTYQVGTSILIYNITAEEVTTVSQ